MTPTDRADAHITAAIAEGRSVSPAEMWELYGVTPGTVQTLVDLALEAAEPPYVPAQRVQGPEMAPGRKAQIVGDAQAKAVPRKPGRT